MAVTNGAKGLLSGQCPGSPMRTVVAVVVVLLLFGHRRALPSATNAGAVGCSPAEKSQSMVESCRRWRWDGADAVTTSREGGGTRAFNGRIIRFPRSSPTRKCGVAGTTAPITAPVVFSELDLKRFTHATQLATHTHQLITNSTDHQLIAPTRTHNTQIYTKEALHFLPSSEERPEFKMMPPSAGSHRNWG